MDFRLDERSRRMAEIGKRLAGVLAPGAADADERRLIPAESFAELRSAGLYGAGLPTDLGGLGAGSTAWLATVEQLAQGDASTALGFNMHYVATRLVGELPSFDAAARKHVASLVIDDGALISAPLSEPSSSSLLPGSFLPTVTATRTPDGGLRVSGTKMYASIWEASDYAFMLARPDWSDDPTLVVAFLLPVAQPENIVVEDVWDTLGMRATRSNKVTITDAHVPAELVLGPIDDFVTNWIVARAAVTWGGYTACYLGLAEAMVSWLTEALGTRTAKGYAQPMGYHPTISSAVGRLSTHVEAARLMMYRAAWKADTEGPGLGTCHAYLQAKLMLADAIGRVIELGTTAGGLTALMRPRGYERMLRDVTTAAIMPPNAYACAEMAGLITMGLDPAQAPSLAPLPVPAPAPDRA
ncbi:acyl-CoA dehydrogenase [Actinomadura spongiicola]|uniref:Acyl-CoA dehydrogenase n=1 Tax=Actinomadura spongiicola TaxID=2303421 RepID=A0A372GG78_9ACTN|nr:acyl-CoA dehydrogenase family protein [Actinomadura spongiicola]RFS84192.1 acyl-CoA dehydrogenase [Actinomadura spongiicola]